MKANLQRPVGLLCASLSMLLAACGGSVEPSGAIIKSVNNRADMVSGGDALLEIQVPDADTGRQMKVAVDGRDVTSAFAVGSDGRITGLVTGLVAGANRVTVTANGKVSELVLTNAPRSGPVMSGAQVKPFYCATPTPQVTSGNTPATNASGLSGQPDADCNIATEYQLWYKTTTAGCSLSLPDPTPSMSATATVVPQNPTPPANACFKKYTAGTTPADMATTTTDAGVVVPYIVRVERGTMNRGIYDIAVLFDPAKPWSAVSPQGQWNGKVYVNFGASTGQPRRQARPATAWSSADAQLSRGWMVMANSMTDSARNSNRVLMSETVMMMKEHISDAYGPIAFTVGNGCSGGSINSNMNASINPGLLDGVTTTCTYPDSETTSLEVGDCTLLVEAYQKPQWQSLMATGGAGGAALSQPQEIAKKAAINGHPDHTGCQAWFNLFGSNGRAGLYNQRTVGLLGGSTQQNQADQMAGTIRTSPTTGNNCELPNTAVYDPANPVATASLPRCNAWAWGESIWGKVAGGTVARDTRDNVGVQYGLKALQTGAITGEEFVTLNEIVGGIDRDSTPRAARTTADLEALDIAYRSGIVMSGKQFAKTAVIDMRGWDESQINLPTGLTGSPNAIHHLWYSFGIRDRLVKEYGDAGNQAIWRFARTGLGAPGTMGTDAFLAMDQWLTAVKADRSTDSVETKVRRARPASTADFCLLPGDVAQTTKVTDAAVCDADPFLKPGTSPRQVAGGPRAENILKCQLKPLDATEYGGRLNAAQVARLQAVFTSGVCDWSKPGVGQQAAVSPLTFRNGPGGEVLGAAPASVYK